MAAMLYPGWLSLEPKSGGHQLIYITRRCCPPQATPPQLPTPDNQVFKYKIAVEQTISL